MPLKNVGPVSAASNAALNFRESLHALLSCAAIARHEQADRSPMSLRAAATFGKPYDFVGTKTFGNASAYEAYARSFIYDINIPGCNMPGRVFVGQRKEPFAVNLGRVFDLVNLVPVEGDSAPGAGDGKGFPGGITQDRANKRSPTRTSRRIALEMPETCLTGSGNGVIGGVDQRQPAPGADARIRGRRSRVRK